MYVSFGIEKANVAARTRTDSLPYAHAQRRKIKMANSAKEHANNIELEKETILMKIPFYIILS